MNVGAYDCIDYYTCTGCNLLVRGDKARAFLEDDWPNGDVYCTERGNTRGCYSESLRIRGRLTSEPISKLNEMQKVRLRIIQYAKSTSVPGGC